MTWEDFLKQIATEAGLRNRPRKVFMTMFGKQDDRLSHLQVVNQLSVGPGDIDIGIDKVKNDCRIIYRKFETKFELSLAKGRARPRALQDFLGSTFKKKYDSKKSQTSFRQKFEQQNVDLSQLLLEFDYVEQSRAYEDRCRLPVLSFLVRAECRYVQKWLIKRLASRLNAFSRPNDFVMFPIDVDIEAELQYCDMNSFWPLISMGGETALKKDDVKGTLKKLYAENKTVVIALYGVEKLNDSIVKGLLEFWREVYDELSFQVRPGVYSKLVLLLSDSRLEDCPFHSDMYELDKSVIELLPEVNPLISFPEEDITDFLFQGDLASMMEKARGPERYLENCRMIQSYSTNPTKVLDEICYMFKIRGFATFVEAWDLAYDR